MTQQSLSHIYEPSSEPFHISSKQLFLNLVPCAGNAPLHLGAWSGKEEAVKALLAAVIPPHPTPSHLRTLTPHTRTPYTLISSHPRILTTSHPHTLTPSHPAPSHPHTLTPSHHHTLTTSHPHTLHPTPSHPHTLAPSHPHILTPSHPHTLHPHILTPSHPHNLHPHRGRTQTQRTRTGARRCSSLWRR